MKSVTKYVWIPAGLLLSAFLMVGQASAQNFADYHPNNNKTAKPQSQEDLITKKALEAAHAYDTDATGASSKSTQHYTLGATDVIDIEVMRHPEVSGTFIINKAGDIQYNFVGDVKIAGLTKDQATKLIKKRLAEYIINPDVTVTITGYNSKIVYVVGEVGRPGKIYMHGDTITVREALMEAGLPLLSGVTKRSDLITPSDNGKIKKKIVNVYALLYQGDLRQNYVMKPGDVLYIPPTFLTKAIRAITPVAAPVSTTTSTARNAALLGTTPGL